LRRYLAQLFTLFAFWRGIRSHWLVLDTLISTVPVRDLGHVPPARRKGQYNTGNSEDLPPSKYLFVGG